MLKLFPRVILADKTTELRLSGDELKSGTKVTVSVQSMEKYNVPHTDKYRIDEDNRLIARDIVVNGGEAKFDFTPFGEQRHRVYIDTGARKATFEIYSLKEDLYKLTPLKGDTHLHTTESDGLFTPHRNGCGVLRGGVRLYGYNRPPQIRRGGKNGGDHGQNRRTF